MNPPHVKHVVRDEQQNITYKLWTYRQLNPGEVRFYTLNGIARMKRKPKPNKTYDIITVIGASDGFL